MQVAIRKMGNSQGIVIPKPVLLELGLDKVAEMTVREGVIELRAVPVNPRASWAGDSARIAAAGDDVLAWPEFGNADDADLKW